MKDSLSTDCYMPTRPQTRRFINRALLVGGLAHTWRTQGSLKLRHARFVPDRFAYLAVPVVTIMVSY